MDRDPLTGIPPSRHPFQIWILGAGVFSGAQSLIVDAAPASIEDLVPEWAVNGWAVLILIAGVLGLMGGQWKDRVMGLLMERLALAALALATGLYGLVLVTTIGKPGAVAAIFQVSCAIASAWRIVHVNRELKVLKRWIAAHYQPALRRPFRDPAEGE